MSGHVAQPLATLDRMFIPRGVAVIGASPRPGALSGRFVSELDRHGYRGRIAPVNPRHAEVLDFRCFPTVADAAREGPIDLTVIALPQESVLEALQQSHAAGAGASMIFTAGFSETGEEGRTRERELTTFAHRTGLRLLGPNCPGFINVTDSVCLMMSSISFRDRYEPGGISIVAQSGGVAGIVCERAQDAGIGLGRVLCSGNESDVTFGEILRWMAADDATRVVAGYLEGIRDPEEFVAGLGALRAAGKPVVIMKVGATGAGARASEAHTGALATADDVVDSLFMREGVTRVFGFDDLIDTAAGLAGATAAAAPVQRVGILTTSGGVGTVAAEAAERAGLQVVSLSERTRTALAAAMPDYASLRNPVDMTAMFQEDLSIFDRCLQAFAGAQEIDQLVLSVATHAPAMAERIADQFIAYARGGHTPPVIFWSAGEMSGAARRRLRRAGLVVSEDADRCMQAIAARGRAASLTTRSPLTPAAIEGLPHRAQTNELEALRAFAAAGLPAVESIACSDGVQAEQAARSLRSRVVVKACARGLLHKARIGAVEVGISEPAACAQAHDRVVAAAAAAGLAPEGSIVQRLAPGGFELVIGVRRDPDFGAILVVAPGGAVVELGGDIARRLLPLREGEAAEMLSELAVYPRLAGTPAAPGADLPAAIAAIEALARFADGLGDRLRDAEINPLILHGAGEGATAVDAVLVLESES